MRYTAPIMHFTICNAQLAPCLKSGVGQGADHSRSTHGKPVFSVRIKKITIKSTQDESTLTKSWVHLPL